MQNYLVELSVNATCQIEVQAENAREAEQIALRETAGQSIKMNSVVNALVIPEHPENVIFHKFS